MEVLDEIVESAKDYKTFDEWYEHSKDFTIALNESADPDQDGVRLLTMHSSKGLEFKHVFIIDANEGTTPYAYRGEIGDVEEERRMFYVAMTRAKERIHISYIDDSTNGKCKVSRFVKELQPLIS